MTARQHLFFDLDHTLWDFETNSRIALKEVFETLNLQGKGVTSFDEFIAIYEKENERAWRLYRNGEMKKEVLRTIRFGNSLAKFDIQDESLNEEMASEYLERSPYKTVLVPGTMELLDYLKTKGYPLHILTNGFEEVQGIKMKESGLSPFFDHVITSEFIGVRKPHPKAFLGSASHVGADVTKAFMIGDNLEADVLGAKNVGMSEVYFNPSSEKHDHDLKFEIQSLLELKTIL